MALTEILATEKQRKEKLNPSVIHLFKDGTFYRAYNFSAWLISQVTFSAAVQGDRKPLAVSRKPIRDSTDTFCMAGFPVRSLEKYIPKEMIDGFTAIDDTHVTVDILLPKEVIDMGEEAIAKQYNEWHESMPISQDNPHMRDSKEPPYVQGRQSLSSIMAQILAFPLERKSPVEVVNFMSEIRTALAQLF